MTATNKRHKQSIHKQRENKIFVIIFIFISIHIDTNDNSQTVKTNDSYDIVDDHRFIAPFEIFGDGIGLLSVLMNKHIIDTSFSKLYQQR